MARTTAVSRSADSSGPVFPSTAARPVALRDLALFFLKLGTTAFGGPAAHIAMMQRELVVRRKWVAESEFLDLLAAANILPGPTSTELAIYIGYLLAGFRGLLIAGVCFILPAFAMVTAIAWAYVRYDRLLAVAAILYGIKPVVLAIVVQALSRLGVTAIKNRPEVIVGIAATVAAAIGVNSLVVLAGSAMIGIAQIPTRKKLHAVALIGPASKPFAIAAAPVVAGISAVATLPGLFFVFLKLGCVVFGSGYVLLAFLRDDLVTRRHWLTESKLLDAIAVGQITPGPVFTTATFIGYLIAGPAGAIVATVGIFCPAFFFVAVTGRLVKWLRSSPVMAGAIDGLRVASLALMAVATWQLATAAVVDDVTAITAAAGLIVLMICEINSTWLVAIGAGIGLLRIAI